MTADPSSVPRTAQSLVRWSEGLRDLVGYGNEPQQLRWPNGARLALSLVVNYEEGSERNPTDGDAEPESLGGNMYTPRPRERDLIAEAAYEYGSRVGIWRVLEVLDRYKLPVSVFACGLALERNPAVAQALRARGYDMVGHGYRWVTPVDMSEDEERSEIRKEIASIEDLTGQRISGWLSRGPHSTRTRRLLAEEGLLFDTGFNDDTPYYQSLGGRPFIVLPYSLATNDWGFMSGHFRRATDFTDYCKDSFDVLYAEGAHAPRMMSIGLHPRVIGQPGHIEGIARFIDYVLTFPDVWITTRTTIANYWLENVPFVPAEDTE